MGTGSWAHFEGMPTEGLVVIGRFEGRPFRDARPERQPVVPFSHDEIRVRHRGVEGELWPEEAGIEAPPAGVGVVKSYGVPFPGLAPSGAHESVRRYYELVGSKRLCDLLYVDLAAQSRAAPLPSPPGFAFCGYEYGVLLESNYSVIYNELIYGMYSGLRTFGSLLNDCLLFPSLEAVAQFEAVRDELVRAGAHLEVEYPEDEYGPIGIYGAVSRSAPPG